MAIRRSKFSVEEVHLGIDGRAPGEGEVQILLFSVGEELYGCDASQVLRIDGPRPTDIWLEALGALAIGSRALVFRTDGGESQLRVDAVSGVVNVPVQALRRMPPSTGARAWVAGLWLNGKGAMVLVDLELTTGQA